MAAGESKDRGVEGLSMPERINAVARRPLYEEALLAIRAAILRGSFAPGERLYGPDLAGRLGLSRGPVREALNKLEQEGIVVSNPHHGSSVVRIDDAELYDAIEIREFIETLHCDRLIGSLTDDDLVALEVKVDEMREAGARGDAAALAEADYEFHERLISIGGSQLMHRVWRSIGSVLQMSLAVSDAVFLRAHGDVAREHQPILDALRARDAQLLETALREHLGSVAPLLSQAEQSAPES